MWATGITCGCQQTARGWSRF